MTRHRATLHIRRSQDRLPLRRSGAAFSVSVLLLCWLLLFPSGCSQQAVPPEISNPTWKVFTTASTDTALLSDMINDVMVGANNRVWFATDSGVSSYFRGTWLSYREEIEYSIDTTSTVYRRVECISKGTDLAVWFGLVGGGLFRHAEAGSSSKWVHYTTANGLLSDYVRAATCDRVGDMWFATGIGICRFHPLEGTDNGVWTSFLPAAGTLPSGNITAIRANPVSGIIWIGTRNGDLVSFDGNLLWEQQKVPLNASPVRCIAFEDPSGSTTVGSIWVGTDDGAFRFTPSSGWREYSISSTGGALTSNFINAILVRPDGTVWLATDKGLAKLSRGSVTTYSKANSPLPADRVLCAGVDDVGNLWLGTSGGVAEFNEDGIR